MSKKNTAAPAAATQSTKPESSLDGLNIQAPKTFKGLFVAWRRVKKVDPKDPSKTVVRAKCVCTVPSEEDPDVKVDITAWISEETAKAAGITICDRGTAVRPFVGTFAYEEVQLEAERGQYNEERSLYNAKLLYVD